MQQSEQLKVSLSLLVQSCTESTMQLEALKQLNTQANEKEEEPPDMLQSIDSVESLYEEP